MVSAGNRDRRIRTSSSVNQTRSNLPSRFPLLPTSVELGWGEQDEKGYGPKRGRAEKGYGPEGYGPYQSLPVAGTAAKTDRPGAALAVRPEERCRRRARERAELVDHVRLVVEAYGRGHSRPA